MAAANNPGRMGDPILPGAASIPDAPAAQHKIPIAQAMERAFALYNSGRLQAAAELCAKILKARPRMAEAHNLMAVLLNADGKQAEAVKELHEAIALDGGNVQFLSNLGEIERQRGKTAEALAALRQAVSIDPNSAQALNNLGIVLYDRREFQEAVDCYEKAVARNGSYPEAYNNLGNALRALGKGEEALDYYQRAILIRENYPEAYNNMASVLRDKDMILEAEHAYRKAIEMKPGYLEAYGNLASLMVQEDRKDEALRVLGKALEIDAKHAPTLVQVARTQIILGNYSQAEQACRLAIKSSPDDAEAHGVLAQVFHETDRFKEAIATYEQALKLKPESADIHNLFGVCLKSVGRLEDARNEFLKALELNPRSYGTYANLSDMEKYTREDPHFITMENIMKEATDPNSERYMSLHFALGKAYEDIGEYETAFHHYRTGTALKRAKLDYDEAEAHGFFDSIREIFNAEFLAKPPFPGNPSELPIFIVGMPRSGSTLVEQILSSHPDTFGAGEIKELSRRIGALRSRFPGLPKYPQIASKMNSAHYQIVADGYLQTLRGLSPTALRITDKLLTNYYFVGLIHILFPKARIINTRRNPIDTCLSAYTKLFKDDMPHSYDLGELGRYYRKYEALMDHWQAVLPPGVIKTVVYEDVVDDLEKLAREIVDFVGLPWNDACLSFHESGRPVKTASVVQVRKPVYRTSVERWKRYGSHMQPLIDSLGINAT